MNITIRHEQEHEHFTVENLMREAFWNLYFPGTDIPYATHKIRQHKDFIPEISFVLEIDNELAGAIFYTHSKVVDSQGNEFPTITFGPVAILPKFQRQGLGSKLITHSLTKAKELGYKAVMICGYPYHYEPLGFIGSKKYNISFPDGNFYTGAMALPLQENALDDVSGHLFFSEVFEEYSTEILDEYDIQFPKKEKLSLPSHEEFAKAVVEIDTKEY